MLDNFVKAGDMPQEVIEKYRDRVPEELVQIWQEDGLGTFLDGYLKVINPDDYIELVRDSYFNGERVIPIFVTAFGDVVTWEDGAYVGLLEYKSEDVDIMIKNFKHFLRFVGDDDFKEEFFDFPLFHQAVVKYGELAFDECFGFVPLLPLGGKKDVKHMDKVKILEHLDLLVQVTGGIPA